MTLPFHTAEGRIGQGKWGSAVSPVYLAVTGTSARGVLATARSKALRPVFSWFSTSGTVRIIFLEEGS
jgi:hypothetical protein